MKKSVLVVMLIVLSVLFVACGGKQGVEGNWESVYMGEGDTFIKAVGMIKFEFKADKTVVGDAMGQKAEGTWKQDGDKYLINIDNVENPAVIENDLLVVTISEMSKMYFSRDAEKFDKFPEGTVGAGE